MGDTGEPSSLVLTHLNGDFEDMPERPRKYEYKVEQFTIDTDFVTSILQGELNSETTHGWRLHTCHPGTYTVVCIFEREVHNASV